MIVFIKPLILYNMHIHFFREEASLVDMFVIEMLVTMISSLQLAHRDDKSLGKVKLLFTIS